MISDELFSILSYCNYWINIWLIELIELAIYVTDICNILLSIYLFIYMSMCVCVCVCMRVCEHIVYLIFLWNY